jgi:putative ABC transport system permease protein
MTTLWQDVRYGFRMLVRNPGFTVIVVVILAVGIGANTAVFALLNELLFRPQPVKKPDELRAMVLLTRQGEYSGQIIPYPVYLDYSELSHAFSELVAYSPVNTRIRIGERRLEIQAQVVSGNFFSALAVRPTLGRSFLEAEDRVPMRDAVAILSDEFWRSRWDSDPHVIGRTVVIDDYIEGPRVFTIVGVAPRGFRGFDMSGPALWLPTMMHAHFKKSQPVSFHVIGRLAAGVSSKQAVADLDVVTQRIFNKYQGERIPGYEADPPFRSDLRVQLSPAGRGLWGPFRSPQSIWQATRLSLTVVGLVLLIACGNVANLLVARAVKRRKEFTVRLSLGASSLRLLRQLLTESLVLSLLACGVGLLFSKWSNDLLLAWKPAGAELLVATHLDVRVVAFALAVAVLTGLVFGLAPGWHVTKLDLNSALKEESRASAGRKGWWTLRNGLVVGQMAFSLLLLVCAGLCLRSFEKLQNVDPGFNLRNTINIPLNLDDTGYASSSAGSFYQSLMDRIAVLPGVTSVSFALSTPLAGGSTVELIGPPEIEGYAPHVGEKLPLDADWVGPEYFETVGIPIVRQPDATLQERATLLWINEAFARRYWPGQNPIGKRIASMNVDGVVRDSRIDQLWKEPEPHVYVQHARPFGMTRCSLITRTKGDALAVLAALRREILSVNAQLDVSRIQTLEQIASQSLAGQRLTVVLLGTLALMALLLAGVGIYGVMSFVVSQRTREIGVRIALGARTYDVMSMVVGRAMMLALTGVILGLVAALVVMRTMTSLLFEVKATDPLTFAGVSLVLLGAALLACYLPARRAARVDPMVALRYE